MRTLTIERKKTFVASAMAMKVYIEDPESSDLQINGVSCRKLGKVKNGQMATFEISDEAARVYVVADKLSKNLCNEFYPIPAGTKDVSLSGKNHFNPAVGNPFYFDGVTDVEVLKNRTKGKNKGFILIIIAALLGGLVGFLSTSALFDDSDPAAEAKTFSSDGMQITLTEEFTKTEYSGFTVCYDSRDVAVFGLKESFSLAAGFENYTLQEYAQLVLDANGFEGSVSVQDSNDLVWFEYVAKGADNQDYYYFCVTYKADDAFWLVEFTTAEDQAEDMFESFILWAKSVTFE